MSCSTSVSRQGWQVAVTCDLCESGTAGEHYCTVCKQTLCTACKKIHEKVPVLKNHRIILRSEIAVTESKQMSCLEHKTESVSLHCLTCKVNICVRCATGRHSKHSMTGMITTCDEEMDDARNELESSSEFEDTVVRVRMQGEATDVQTTEVSVHEAIECRCQEHINEWASMHCEKCNVPVCTKCVTGKHRGHPMADIHTTFEHSKADLEKKVADVEQNVLPRCIKAINDLHERRESFQKKVANIRMEMEEEVQKLKVDIDCCQDERNQKLDTKERNDLNSLQTQEKEFENLRTKINQNISNCKNHLNACERNPAAFLKIVGQREKISHKVPDPVSPEIPHFRRMSERSVSGILGKLELTQTRNANKTVKPCNPHVVSTFYAGVGSSPTLCLTKSGLAWVGGRESRELRLVKFSLEVPERKKLETRLFAIAVMGNDNIVLSPHCEDSRLVLILKTDGTEEIIFDASPSYTEGLSVTSEQHILVCTADGRLVKCNPETKSTKQIYRGCSTLYQAIELPDKTICISDWGSCQLLIIDQEGNVVTKISRPLGRGNFLPRGVVCDRAGNVLFSDQKNNCIYIMDPGRHIRELVKSSHGIKSPDWLVLDTEDNLMVTNDEGQVTIVKYLTPVSD